MTKERYLLRAAEIEAMDGVKKVHFMNPNAKRTNKSLGDATGLTGLGIHLIEVASSCESTEFHVHYHEDEAVYVLSGTGSAHIGDTVEPIGPGDFIGYRKGGLGHTIVNDGADVLRCLVIGQRLPQDVGDYLRKGKRIFRQEGLPWNLVDLGDIETPSGGAK